jgi:hypothetical protein
MHSAVKTAENNGEFKQNIQVFFKY